MTKTPLDSRAEHGDTVDTGHVTRDNSQCAQLNT